MQDPGRSIPFLFSNFFSLFHFFTLARKAEVTVWAGGGKEYALCPIHFAEKERDFIMHLQNKCEEQIFCVINDYSSLKNASEKQA